MQKDTDFDKLNLSEYTVACFGCKSKENLVMIAHRGKENNVGGWIFCCEKCATKFLYKTVKIELCDVEVL